MKNIEGVTKWLASAGLIGSNVAGQVGTCCGVGFYVYNNNYALVYSFLLVGQSTRSQALARSYAHAHTVSINICDFTGYEPVKRTHLTLSLRTPCSVPTYPVTGVGWDSWTTCR